MQTPSSKFTSTVIEETIIKPQSPSDGSTINFSRQDRIIPALPVPLLSFYDRRLDHKALAESLARVLVKFPILAGTFHAVEGKPPTAVELNDAGVAFQVAETDATLDDFGEFSFRKNKEAFLLPLVNTAPTSVLTVKITYLKKTEDGREGTVVGTSMHHYVVDAESNSLFINTWAEETRGKGEGGSAFPHPIHDRSIMDALVSKPGEENRMADPPSWQYKDPAEFFAAIMHWVQTKLPGAKTETVNFSKEGLEKLKAELSPESGWISTNDALVALIWQATTIMRKIDDNRNMKIGFALNTRKRFDPPLPAGYFGNAIQYVIVELPASRVKTMPLKELAERIRTAVNNFSDPTIRAHLTWLKEQTENRGGDMAGLQHNWESDDLALTSWASYPLYGSDFGAGKPIWVGPAHGNAPGFVMFLPTAEGGIRAMIHFAADEEEHFDTVTLPLLQQYS